MSAATMEHILHDWGGLNEALFHSINGVDGAFHDGFMLLGTLLVVALTHRVVDKHAAPRNTQIPDASEARD